MHQPHPIPSLESSEQPLREWTTPETEELSLEEIIGLAEVQVAFATTSPTCDLDP